MVNLARPAGVEVIQSAATARGPQTTFRATRVPWDVRLWVLQHKPFRAQTHQPWVQTYKDPTPRIIEQASEGSAFPNGIVIVSCDTCQQTALPIPDAAGYARSWRHACDEELEAAAEAALDLEHVREGCTRSVILFVSELFAYPELLVQVVDVLEKHSFAHVLDMIQDDAKDNDLADLALLLPAGVDWEEEAAQAPPVLVAPGSSRRWVAVNAVGLAHALVAGRHEQLESCRRPDIQALRSWVEVVSNAKYDIPALECVLHLQGCDYVRLMGKSSKQATHRCTVAGPDEATKVKSFGRKLHSTDDLPTPYRLALLASLFFGNNLAGVQPSTFTWVGDGPEPEKQRTRTDRKGGAEKRRFKPAIPVSGSKREAVLSKRPYKSNVEIQQMLAGPRHLGSEQDCPGPGRADRLANDRARRWERSSKHDDDDHLDTSSAHRRQGVQASWRCTRDIVGRSVGGPHLNFVGRAHDSHRRSEESSLSPSKHTTDSSAIDQQVGVPFASVDAGGQEG